jgi:hypothetical protein
MPRFLINILVLLSLSLSVSTLSSQNVALVLNVGDDLFEQGDYFASIGFYKKALQLDSGNAEILYKYGRNLVLINNPAKATRYLKKALIIDRDQQFPSTSFELAEAYRLSGDYRKARQYYNKAMQPYRNDRQSYWYKKINQQKDAAEWAYKNNNTSHGKPSNLGKLVNSNAAEFAATIHDKKLYFTALIADSLGVAENSIKDQHYYSRIFVKSLLNDEGTSPLKWDANAEKQFAKKHLANPAFFKDELYFSVCDTNFKCEIWKGKIENDQLSDLSKLNNNINDPSSNNTQAKPVSIDEVTYLFFVSDRKKGLGGLDIWVAKEEDFGFDQAVNLGPEINTPDNEITPFYHAKSNTLYFSSNWHIGFGGYDIFSAKGGPLHFKEVENLGWGYNSSYNDSYFEPIEGLATFTSNRHEGNTEKNNCCNDLYESVFQVEETKEKEEDTLVLEVVSIEVLNKYLPLELFFHNDQPNPNSRDTTTTLSYPDLASSYAQLRKEYEEKYLSSLPPRMREEAKGSLNYFFSEELPDGLEELAAFTPLLLKELSKGSKIELTIKGFASSLSASDYNLNLTLRRIASLINYFSSYENGALLPYLDDTAENGGELNINRVPFGEFAVKQNLTEEDKIAAIYSPAAIHERKIELIAVTNSNENSQINLEEQAAIDFNTRVYDLGIVQKGEEVKRFFQVENTGSAPLKLYNVSSNCECVSFDYPNTISPGEKERLWLSIDTEKLNGKINLQVLVVSNTTNNLNELTIDFTVAD